MLRKKKILLAAVAGCTLSALLLQGNDIFSVVQAHAGTTSATSNPDQTWNNLIQSLGIFGAVIQIFTFKLVYILGVLIDPRVFLGMIEVDGIGGALHDIWKVSRDIMNVILAILLVTGAVIAIVTANKDQVMPYVVKLILAVILVNFSWFFPRVVLDVSNVLTAAVYTLPNMTGVQCHKDGAASCRVWKEVRFWADDWKTIDEEDDWECYYEGAVCVHTKGHVLAEDNSPMAIMTGLLYNHGRMGELTRVSKDNSAAIIGGGIGTGTTTKMGSEELRALFKTVMQYAFIVLLSIALFFPLLAMFFAFMIRIPYLWITIAFMPFMFLGFVIGDKMGQFNTMNLIWKKFVASAFLPFATAIPLSVGFILLNAASSIWGPDGGPMPDIFKDSNQFLIVGVDNFLELLWLIMTFMVIWTGTFAAFKIDKAYEGIGSTVQGWGKAWGKFALAAPLSVPFIPTGKGFVSPLGVKRAAGPTALTNLMTNKAEADARKAMFGDSTPPIGNASANAQHFVNKFTTNAAFRSSISMPLQTHFRDLEKARADGNQAEFTRKLQEVKNLINGKNDGKPVQSTDLAPIYRSLNEIHDPTVSPNIEKLRQAMESGMVNP